jgi:hypothetical protein
MERDIRRVDVGEAAKPTCGARMAPLRYHSRSDGAFIKADEEMMGSMGDADAMGEKEYDVNRETALRWRKTSRYEVCGCNNSRQGEFKIGI